MIRIIETIEDMADQKYMQLAIQVANKSSEKIPVGVVVVKDGQVLAETYNSQHSDNKIASHAEMKAIDEVEKRLNSKNIAGCTVYTTCEPCTMCAGALFYVKVDRIVYGSSMKDVDPDNRRIKIPLKELAGRKSQAPAINQLMRKECFNKLYKQSYR